MAEAKALETLSDIRCKIDRIDDKVHDLLMDRASLVSSVAQAKRGDGMQIVQPAREARLMRRLMKRHKEPLPRRTIICIWRELISSVSLLQTGLRVVVADGKGFERWDMAKNYFGSSLPMRSVGGLQNALSEVTKGSADFVVMPWPEMEEENPWWASLFHRQGDESLSIICALPYDKTEALQTSEVADKAVVVSKISFMDSDNDNSFIGLELDADVSRASISEHAKAAKFDLINMYSAPSAHNKEIKNHLLLVKGYVGQSSNKAYEFVKRFGKACHHYYALGGYPVIPDSKD